MERSRNMAKRILTSMYAFAAVTAVVSLGSGRLAAQSTAVKAQAGKQTAARPYTPPRTPWGDPDIQGYFNKF
jgi:hypothetical protein